MNLLFLAALLGTFFTVLAVAYASWMLLNPTRSVSDRLTEMTRGPQRVGPSLLGPRDSLSPVAKTISRIGAPTDEGELDQLRWRLIQAGYRGGSNVELYSGTRVLLTLGLPALYLLLWKTGSGDIAGAAILNGFGQILRGNPPLTALTAISTPMLITLLLAGAGYYLPAIWVTNQRQKRQEELQRFFPDALDLMCTSVEAGLAVDSAFRKVAEEMFAASELLASELLMVTRETSAGVPRVEALRNLHKRTGLDDIGSLVHVLAQAERFGTPIARSLRIHSEMVRTRRMQRAEEKAAKASPKMTVAMIFFILPSLFIILIGPAIINAIHVLMPTIQNIGY